MTVSESAQMPLSHAASPLQGQVTPRHGPVSAGPVSAGGAVSFIEASMPLDVSTVETSSTLASAATQRPELGSHSSPAALQPAHGAMHWCELGSQTSLPGHTAGPGTHSNAGTSAPMPISQPPPAPTRLTRSDASSPVASIPLRLGA